MTTLLDNLTLTNESAEAGIPGAASKEKGSVASCNKAPAALRPYPESLSRKTENQTSTRKDIFERGMGKRFETIPPERRLTVNGHSRHCITCGRFVRAGAAGSTCPGVRARGLEAPACHSEQCMRIPEVDQ